VVEESIAANDPRLIIARPLKQTRPKCILSSLGNVPPEAAQQLLVLGGILRIKARAHQGCLSLWWGGTTRSTAHSALAATQSMILSVTQDAPRLQEVHGAGREIESTEIESTEIESTEFKARCLLAQEAFKSREPVGTISAKAGVKGDEQVRLAIRLEQRPLAAEGVIVLRVQRRRHVVG